VIGVLALLVASTLGSGAGGAGPADPPADHPPPDPAKAVIDGVGAAAPRDVPVAVVPLRLPITGTRDTQVEGTVLRTLDRLLARPGERGVLVFRFDGADDPGAGASDFGRSLALARFLADHVARCLAGVPRAGRPIFLKIPFLGPEVTEQLAAYDRSVVVGILGGGAGTTHDAFGLVAEAKKHGARVALFGRKINAAEHQLAFVKILRAVADGDLGSDEGVRAYHGELAALGIRPHRPLEADLARSATASAYAS
jgi:hypothetical protein